MTKRIRLNVQPVFEDSRKWKFHYEGTQSPWTCRLKKMRCMCYTKSNQRCSRKTEYTLGYCWQHLKSVAHLRIRRTNLKDRTGKKFNFLGLFACDENKPKGAIVFKKHDLIVSYFGEVISKKTLEKRYPGKSLAPYTLVDGKLIIDSACVRGVGSMVNMCRKCNKNCRNNAHIKSNGRDYFPVLLATKNIRNGEEIYLDYGNEYFDKTTVQHRFKTAPVKEYNRNEYRCKT